MLILGIDTSCDDTSAAVVESGTKIVSNVISNQTEIHRRYGGIVPELASRRHVEMIWPVVDEAMKEAGIGYGELACIAVCHGPGLIGSLLVGCSFAKALCYAKKIPLVAVNHLEGHIYSSFLEEKKPDYPFIALIVSGGHTCLCRVDGFGRYRELGRTRDDAAGEAYDKVSKLLGLGYPGGPVIDDRARTGDPRSIDFPRAYLPDSLDFSFSGLKTAVLQYVKTVGGIEEKELPGGFASSSSGRRGAERFKGGGIAAKIHRGSGSLTPEQISDICASFQAAVVDVLMKKTEWAVRNEGIQRVTLSGGVAANSELRKRMGEMAEETGIELFMPSRSLCTDNAAMIAAAGYHRFKAGHLASLGLNPVAYLPL